MSGIAEVLLNLGYKVSGSDLASNAATERLADLGRKSYWATGPTTFASADAVVVSSAVKPDNLESWPPRPSAFRSCARADARRAHAPEAGDRGGRDPRQDHHHESHRERARRRRVWIPRS